MSDGVFAVKFWGVRGTVPCPGPKTLRYGGNTSCVEMRCGAHRLIFDAGTGLRLLGNELIKDNGSVHAQVFLTHTHIDHIQGLPFFRPAYAADNHFEFWNGHLRSQQRSLQDVLYTLMQRPFFPVPLDILHACIGFHDFAAGEVLEPVAGVRMRTAALNHPGGATGYRVEYDGRSVCYITDTEHIEGELDVAVLRLIDASDVVIYDSTFTEQQYLRYRGWGHSTWQQGVRLCREAAAKRLIAFHHEPDNDDDMLDGIANELAAAMPGSLVASEGLELMV
jgi:phosphoribosyl 1,2-cyclic phosphodiesterase